MTIQQKTGKGVRIAVLDSGVNDYHSHIGQRLTGSAFRVNREGLIEQHDNVRDYLGHGTAIAALLRYVVPDATLLIGKIFDEKLACYPSVLAVAIDWAIDQRVHVINLSLGMATSYDVVREACERAARAGILIVAARHEEQGLIYPSEWPTVYGVEAAPVERHEWIMRDGVIGACGFPRELQADAQLYNLKGHSFAAAHMSALFAKWIEANVLEEQLRAMSSADESLSTRPGV